MQTNVRKVDLRGFYQRKQSEKLQGLDFGHDIQYSTKVSEDTLGLSFQIQWGNS